jgi:hypothetical protein
MPNSGKYIEHDARRRFLRLLDTDLRDESITCLDLASHGGTDCGFGKINVHLIRICQPSNFVVKRGVQLNQHPRGFEL